MCLHTNVHIYMINQSTGLINTLQYKIAGLCYLKSFNPRHLNNISSIMQYNTIQYNISLEMPVPSQGHYGFHSFPVVD